MNASRSVVFLIAGATGVTLLGQLAEGETPKLRVLIAGTGAAVVLSLLAGAAPNAARLFAVLVFLGAVLGPGYSLIKAGSRLID